MRDCGGKGERTWAKEGEEWPIFGPDAPDVSYKEALRMVSRSHNGANWKAPSEHLTALIRSARLPDVGYALPRRVTARPEEEDTMRLKFSEGGSVVTESKWAKNAPPLQNIEEFFHALLATILPCFIDRPQAMMQWITFARSTLLVHVEYGWQHAADFVQKQMEERLSERSEEGLATPSWRVMQSIVLRARSINTSSSSSSSSAAGPAA